MVVIKTYEEKYKNEIIDFILHIQNDESGVNLTIDDQPDLLNINKYYIENGGSFLVAVDDNDKVIGTLALLKMGEYAVLKKFFISLKHRGLGLSDKLFEHFLKYCFDADLKAIVLDTPSVCKRAHGFYLKKGFMQIKKGDLPVQYEYADRNSIYFIKYLI